jgi:hypothetical protein
MITSTNRLSIQALLDHVPGEVLGAEVPAGDQPKCDAEQHGDHDVEERPADRLAEADRVRAAAQQQPVQRQQSGDQRERDTPGGRGDRQSSAAPAG